ncbi:MAG: hypothetical protein EWV55_22355 [Microcystis viridis Mv_BB_P_19951000_S69]|uniref:Uncharacterized protein n=1 Tax=Microcystis viridis Mv_BB_P_19951000_S68D TaxID=2486270 RepID=A0A552HUR2_MICVR|nr:MAG: hypothetical protein EWV55_22355 [Microcystis viridis Mv_BB_P_19951000_S69]TRU70750.1 MAG: hypothetical protein EWV47_18320 [Microcystis viridis Mv_BB_P_19951000_S68]TRU74938.1 MAG: hypothetical protein EWV77_09490 [Microcystis viridis Mv_BB_P_19951000_S68D]TRU87107.1 MAG: hypothetical protein EWV46_08805 [Microcystis viridis Mv_BB_P_19951000_S69D]
METDEVIALLDKHKYIVESYVLVRELKIFLNVGAVHFYPKIRIKIWKSSVNSREPFHFTVSHNVHTPTQFGPYDPSVAQAVTESQAIHSAISAITTFLVSAINEGHEPSDDWLVPNEDF